MSEYWKSTPKYWCKHCSVYIRDTKLERSNHEGTTKHQSNLNRFLRDIHRDKSRAEREKQRAKDEVARLNGTQNVANESEQRLYPAVRATVPVLNRATTEERRKQVAQLAGMGVTVPDEYRGELAIAGEWQSVSEPCSHAGISSVIADSASDAPSLDEKHQAAELKRQSSHILANDSQDRREWTGWGISTKSYADMRSSSAELEHVLQRYGDDRAPAMSETRLESLGLKVEQTEDDMPKSEYQSSSRSKRHRDLMASDDETEIVFKKRRPKPVKK